METPIGTPNRRPPMASTTVASPGLNSTIDTNYISVDPGDTSACAKTTRLVISCTSRILTPRQVLMIIRTLQTFTFAVLVFTVISDLMYLVFVSLASTEVNVKVGGVRDAIIRVYGLAMTIMALMIQFDVASFLKYFSGLRGYVPRSLLLFFIATITSPNPLHAEYAFNRNKNEVTDDNFDDYYDGDDQVDQQVSAEIPGSTVRFQMVISFLLILCALAYFILGILCCDRLSARAFVSESDPVKATAIPQPSTTQISQVTPSHVDPEAMYTPME